MITARNVDRTMRLIQIFLGNYDPSARAFNVLACRFPFPVKLKRLIGVVTETLGTADIDVYLGTTADADAYFNDATYTGAIDTALGTEIINDLSSNAQVPANTAIHFRTASRAGNGEISFVLEVERVSNLPQEVN